MLADATTRPGMESPILLPIASPIVDANPRLRWTRGQQRWNPRSDPRFPRSGPCPPPVDEAGWYERWAVSLGGVVIPVEFYSGVVAPEHSATSEARVLRPGVPGLPDLVHMAIRFGAARSSAG